MSYADLKRRKLELAAMAQEKADNWHKRATALPWWKFSARKKALYKAHILDLVVRNFEKEAIQAYEMELKQR